jgi:Fic family protein
VSNRSGAYILQPTGYKAFVPAPLPPSPGIHISEDLKQLIHSAEKNLVQLNGIGFLLPHLEIFIAMAIRKEALLSSQIEGTQATLTDVLTYETWHEIENFDDVQEVVNYIKALNEGMEMLDKLPLGLRIIKAAHHTLLQGERGKNKEPGEFRRSQNWIGGNSLKKAVFIPPPYDIALAAMSELEKFMNSKSPLPLLIQCALIHYQFETIHPFLDGNGRIGRLLIDLFLHWKRLLEKPLLYSSLYFKLHRQEYFDTLMRVRNEGDFEKWVSFFVRGIIWSAEYAIGKIKNILQLQEALRAKLKSEKKASLRSIQLLDFLFQKPLVTIASIKDELHVTFQGASDQVALFMELNILEELTGQKRFRRFAFAPYLKIIED